MATLCLVDKDDPLRQKFNFCYGSGVEPIREIESANENKANNKQIDPEMLCRQIMTSMDYEVSIAHYLSDIASLLLSVSRGATRPQDCEKVAYEVSRVSGQVYSHAEEFRNLLK